MILFVDGKSFSASLNDEERKLFLDDMLRLCDASAKLCDSAKKDKEVGLNQHILLVTTDKEAILYFSYNASNQYVKIRPTTPFGCKYA